MSTLVDTFIVNLPYAKNMLILLTRINFGAVDREFLKIEKEEGLSGPSFESLLNSLNNGCPDFDFAVSHTRNQVEQQMTP